MEESDPLRIRTSRRSAGTGDELRCVTVSLDNLSLEKSLEEAIVSIPSDLAMELRGELAEPAQGRAAVVVRWAGGDDDRAREIVIAALRGLVLSLAEEVAPRLTLNIVIAGSVSDFELEPTLAYLAGRGGGHVTMSTLELLPV